MLSPEKFHQNFKKRNRSEKPGEITNMECSGESLKTNTKNWENTWQDSEE